MAIIYGSSQTNPNYSNYRGSQTYNPMSRPNQPTNYFPLTSAPTAAPKSATAPINNGGGGSSIQQPSIPSIDPLMNEVNNSFSQRMSRLDNISSILRGQVPSLISEADQQFGAQKSTLDASKAAGTRQIAQAETDAGARKEDAITAARRQYNDLIRGGIQRFGGASTAGQAFSEIAATESQRQFGDVRNQYEGAMQKITEQKTGLEERYGSALLQLQAVRDNAINNAKRQLDQQLMEIERMKGEAEDAKSQKRLAILQDYRQNIFDVNQQITQYKMSLDQEFQSGQQELTAAEQAFSQYGNNSGGYASEVPNTSSYDIPISQASTQGMQNPIVGYRKPQDEQMDVLSSARNAYSGFA